MFAVPNGVSAAQQRISVAMAVSPDVAILTAVSGIT
jgi:hypothetical protein